MSLSSATGTGPLDRSLGDLVANAHGWARLAIADKAVLLEDSRRRTLACMDRWVALSLAAKGIVPGSHWAGPEWGIGPWFFLLGLTGLHRTMRTLERGRLPQVRVSTRPDGRAVAHVVPATALDRAGSPTLVADVWMEDGVTPGTLSDTMATVHRRSDPSGGVTLVLGAGNAATLGLLDTLHQLYVEGRSVVLKLNPVLDHLEPVFRDILAPWIDDGYVRVVTGGADVGAYLVDHESVDTIHLTGGIATHDAIVFGTGDEGARRRAERKPRIDKPITSELGGVSPVIVVPGPWTRADVAAQAERIVGMKLNNSGHNCMSPQVLILPAGWAGGSALLQEIERQMRVVPPCRPHYPGTAATQRAVIEHHPHAIELPNDEVPRTLVWNVDPAAADELCFAREVFGPVLAQTTLPAPTVAAYLRAAVAFANHRLLGTLAATVLVHPATARQHASDLDRAIEHLRYGTVGVNEWGGLAGIMPQCPWGGAPGAPLHDVQSGRGVVHNSLMFGRTEKTVIRNSFHPAPQAWRHGKPQPFAHPVYSAAHPLGPIGGRRLAILAADPHWRHLPGTFAAIVRGR